MGIDFTSGSVDLNIINGSFKRYIAGVLSISGTAPDFVIEDFETTNISVDIGLRH